MKIVHYKVFESDEAFSKWQMEGERAIHTVSPFIQSFDLDMDTGNDTKRIGSEATTKGGVETTVGCFVTYVEETLPELEENGI